MNNNVTFRLELIAAKAKQLAEDYKANKLYPDDLQRGIRELWSQLELIQIEARKQ